MAQTVAYRGLEIEIISDADGKYGYRISGGGLKQPVETDERVEDADRALALAKDFVDEHLV